MRKSVGQAPTAGEQTQQNPCQTSSDIGADLENHTRTRTRSDIGSERVKYLNTGLSQLCMLLLLLCAKHGGSSFEQFSFTSVNNRKILHLFPCVFH
jgi:hypothetical protein